MKKKMLYIGLSIIIIFLIIALLLLNNKKNSFLLEDKYYGNKEMIEIEFDKFNQLIDKKESFAIFVYQPMCITSSDFENVLYDFLEENSISIYKIPFSNIKNTELGKTIKYYPSFIIYNKGEMVDFLEANKDEDIKYYSYKDEFTKWFTKYVTIKDVKNNSSYSNDSTSSIDDNYSNISLDNVVKEDNKVNIYFFWGNGCPHCEKEFAFFDSIKDKYGKYYNLYTFETWYNEDNVNLLNIFASNMGDKVAGVPYTIIGNKTFSGFSDSKQKEFINAIEEQYNNNYDVYFDKIKK